MNSLNSLDKKRRAIARRRRAAISSGDSGKGAKVSARYRDISAEKKKSPVSLTPEQRKAAFMARVKAKKEEKDRLAKQNLDEGQKKADTGKKKADTGKKNVDEARKERLEARRKREEGDPAKKGVSRKVSSKSAQVLDRIREKIRASVKSKGVGVDEHGTPVVGDGPSDPQDLMPPKKEEEDKGKGVDPNKDKPDTKANPDPVPPEDTGSPKKSEKEEVAEVLVKVNEKLGDIYKREEVDKIVKSELEEIKESLATVAHKVNAFVNSTSSVSEKVIKKEDLTAIVGFLAKVDAAYEKRMVGFEATAKVRDTESLGAIIGQTRVAVDVANEEAHNALKSYNDKQITSRQLKDKVREVKAAVEKWGLVESLVNLFKREASVSSVSEKNVLKVVAFVQDMVAAEKIPVTDMTAQVREYLALSPSEFTAVSATISRVKASSGSGSGIVYPDKMPSTQAGGGPMSLEDCFED